MYLILSLLPINEKLCTYIDLVHFKQKEKTDDEFCSDFL